MIVRHPRALNTKKVIWSPLSRGWFKCNCGSAYSLDTNESGCGGIFMNDRGDFLLAFAENLSSGSPVFANFSGVMSAIDLAKEYGWS